MSEQIHPAPPRRAAAFAGTFYPAEPASCRAAAKGYLAAGGNGLSSFTWRGAIVPHAGWVCSAAIAGESIATIARGMDVPPDVVVVFGAIHTPLPAERAILSSADIWELPTGDMRVQTELRDALHADKRLFETSDRFHANEHAIEVELPLVQSAWPNAMLLPIEVPPTEISLKVGDAVVAEVRKRNLSAVYLASSDLTHYGPDYGFAPAGVGMEGLAWAKQNDRRLLDTVLALTPHNVIQEARQNRNACGAGAIAAMVAACLADGSTRSRLLRHANSFETLATVYPQPPTDAVGYAALVVG